MTYRQPRQDREFFAAQGLTPIEFRGRKTDFRGRDIGPFRTIHLAQDAVHGETLCGGELDFVRQAGLVQIGDPVGLPFRDLCPTCSNRAAEARGALKSAPRGPAVERAEWLERGGRS